VDVKGIHWISTVGEILLAIRARYNHKCHDCPVPSMDEHAGNVMKSSQLQSYELLVRASDCDFIAILADSQLRWLVKDHAEEFRDGS
jgi:hypothetical protein